MTAHTHLVFIDISLSLIFCRTFLFRSFVGEYLVTFPSLGFSQLFSISWFFSSDNVDELVMLLHGEPSSPCSLCL